MAARGRECKHISPYDVTSGYTDDVASMALVRECVAGSYVSTVMKTRPPLAKRVRGDISGHRPGSRRETYLQACRVSRFIAVHSLGLHDGRSPTRMMERDAE